MGTNLKEYAEQHPQQEPERERQAIEQTAKTYRERQQERETVEQLKASIMQQLEEGNEPQFILYTAIKAIGIATQDPAWTAAGQKILDKVYEDLAQQSFITDNAAIAAARLEEIKIGYNEKLKQKLTAQLSSHRRIERALQEALNELGREP